MAGTQSPTAEELIARLRTLGTDTASIEAKAAAGGFPRSLADSLSAFANSDAGGWVLLGLDERNGFAPVKGFKPKAMRDKLATYCNEWVQPPVRADIEIVPVEGGQVVFARIEPVPRTERPCYVKTKGMYGGSFIRGGDGDRRLTEYEVNRLVEGRRQPRWDEEVVDGTTLADLDPGLLDLFMAQLARHKPRTFGDGDREAILQRMWAARVDDDGVLRPTLAGLLALGRFPQEYFPRLTVSFAAYPGVAKAPVLEGQARLLDSVTLDGPVPQLVQDAVAAVARNSRTAITVTGSVRTDTPDYPPDAVREAVANALIHRDLSDMARSSQVQVDLYLDRLVISNPGGLYGPVSLTEVLSGHARPSSRNQRLSNLLAYVPYPDGGTVVENQGTGFTVIASSLNAAGMPPAEPHDSISTFSIVFRRRDSEPAAQAAKLPHIDPKLLEDVRPVLESASTLKIPETVREMAAQAAKLPHIDQGIMDALRQSSSALSSLDLSRLTGAARSTVNKHLADLIVQGNVTAIGSARSPVRRYQASAPGDASF
ncbi:MAG: putative DNA binding domain-containing protein [Bifidobacteriaceae bacterium]|jgi:ATP-dependent DNA helicase RecG|nr:putative DNA binding domain-containing protein [Bifidobacteriaceae bacterium]